jgi:hypothetical protein
MVLGGFLSLNRANTQARHNQRFFTMSGPEINSSLRITCDPADLSWLATASTGAVLAQLGKVSMSKDSTVLVVDLDLDPTSELDQILGRSVTLAGSARDIPGFPETANIAAWVVISSSKEFVGIAIPEDIVRKAAEVRVSFVFSVYASQSDMETSGRS